MARLKQGHLCLFETEKFTQHDSHMTDISLSTCPSTRAVRGK